LISRRRRRTGGPTPRVGLFGLLGSGNLGNDGSMEAVLAYLRAKHPDAVVDALCGGPELVAARYGIDTTPLYWYRGEYQTASGVSAIAMKGFGKVVDAFRTASWVRRHDAVIVPGMGVLEATLPLRPWATPYSLFLLSAAGRVFGTKVALVSVGSNVINERAIRTLVSWAARLASYRSYRDEQSRTAMRTMGVDTSNDEVYPDLAFALPTPPDQPRSTGIVGVGVMAFHGANEDREHAEEIYRGYVDKMKRFVRWLVDQGRQVRLFTGDRVDESVVAEILAEFPGSAVTAAPTSSLDELMREMASVDTVVATRYHNVLCALKLCKPTVSVGYAAKNDVLMSDMGLGRFCHPVRQLDVDRLIDQFTELESQSTQLRVTMAARNENAADRLDHQFAVLSAALLPGSRERTVADSGGT
jgi:polysaccharide pyruvyl transferase WcaK-like protein